MMADESIGEGIDYYHRIQSEMYWLNVHIEWLRVHKNERNIQHIN